MAPACSTYGFTLLVCQGFKGSCCAMCLRTVNACVCHKGSWISHWLQAFSSLLRCSDLLRRPEDWTHLTASCQLRKIFLWTVPKVDAG